MSLLTNYEGLRHQIERLVRENEELKKLVRLIRENHELKSAIRTQAGGLAISGLGEAATGPAPRQGVFLPPPTAANQPGLEDGGMVTLAPLADMLSSPQPSPVTGSIMNPLTGQLNTLLSGSMPMSQSHQLGSLLAGPVGVPPASTLTSSLGAPCTGPLTPGSPLTVPPAGTLASSLGLPSTGPLSSPLTGPLTPNSPMVVAPMGTLTSSLGTISTGPLTGPLTPSSPMTVPPAGTLASSLGPLSTGPLNPSSPMTVPPAGTLASSLGPLSTGPLTPSSPLQAPATAPLAVPQNLLTNPVGNLVLSETTRVRLSEATRRCSSGPQPPAGSGPAAPSKVHDARASRASETSRKSTLELDRKLAHRKTSKFPDSPRESKQPAWERLVGEVAFQLDRRILSSIFPERVRLYGFTVSNIPEKIIQASMNPNDHKLDEDMCQTLTQRYVSVMNRLQSLGYNGRVHPALTEQLVNAYGILRERPELAASEGSAYTVDFLQRVLVETVHPNMLTDALLLLSCLSQLAHDDGKPMFIW
ncbi:speriolin [Orycteropus afer afer]|uniref:Speriolin n=1 Tax=Orycteropus afer afer TaxID=1230840 RepID=A0A8B7B266_ORYAF|nr:speriolin [Orycteropus afer afer]